MPRATTRAQPWPILVLLGGLALAARPPEPDRATELVREVQSRAAADQLDAAWVRQAMQPSALDDLPPAARRSYYHELEVSLAGGLGDALAAGSAVAGVVHGPDYVRVVLEGEPAVTAVVRQESGRPVIERFEPSVCSLCPEPERFVRELLADVQSGRPRLLVGVDMKYEPDTTRSWGFAWNTRNTDAGYLRWVLDGAEVVGSDVRGVDVALAQQTETWPVVYRDGRWQLVYEDLPEDSLLRLGEDGLKVWNSDRHVARQAVAWWVPVMEQRAQGLLLADEVRFVAPRPFQGDLLVYVQDLERSVALVALVDPETGDVARRIGLPTLSKRENHDPETWNDLFVGALSDDGKRLAIGAHRRLWIVDVGRGEVVRTLYDVGGVTALDWSDDGERLAVGDQRGVMVLSGTTLDKSRRHWAETLSPVEGVVLASDTTWMVQEDGLVVELDAELRPTGRTREACCGGVRGVETDPRNGDLLVGCDGSCDPAWLWRWDGQDESAARMIADEGFCATAGTISVAPSGDLLVGPVADGGAALWTVRDEQLVTRFGAGALTQVAWDDERVYGLDARGRAWSWELRELGSR
ncbi:MAG: hypothetical protein GY884_18435 [Proteobacteria bacterium]|nr:hypothetical protein [Pseudomonadota bacterium]